MKKRIPVTDLEIGMYVADMNTPWLNHPFLLGNRVIKTAREIDALQKYGVRDVYIDTEKGVDSRRAVPARVADAESRADMFRELARARREDSDGKPDPLEEMAVRRHGPPSFEKELPRARKLYEEAKEEVTRLLDDARMGRALDGEAVTGMVDGMVASIFRNPDALVNLSRLKSFDEYTYHHSLNVAVLSIALGRSLGLVRDELRRLGIGAILHDVGKMRVPQEILNKPGKFTAEEFSVMKTHTFRGAKLLLESEEMEKECSAVALNHHERYSGNGYPRGIAGMAIGKPGLISAIADVYDAMTTRRVYDPGTTPQEALGRLFEWGGAEFHPVYVQKFIRCVGIYPVGTVVALDTGETGVVSAQNRPNLLRPWVRILRHSSGAPLERPLDVDLTAKDPMGYRAYMRSIASVLPPTGMGDLAALGA